MNQLIFDKNRKRVKQCPCGKSNKDGKFVPFKSYQDKGFCHSCGRTFLPEQSKTEFNQLVKDKKRLKQTWSDNQVVISRIPESILRQSYMVDRELNEVCEKNSLLYFLTQRLGIDAVEHLRRKYFLGTSKYWPGATVFWQVDDYGEIRTGKIMLYDKITGKRSKMPFNHIGWAHRVVNYENFKLEQCLFGLHLLNSSSKPVAIVESEKTAIIADVYLPDFVWMATGGKQNINVKLLKPLAGRKIVLFPDSNAFEEWNHLASTFETQLGSKIIVSDLLERKATSNEKQQGLDLADYLLKYDYRQFIHPSGKSFSPEQMLDKDRRLNKAELLDVAWHTIKPQNHMHYSKIPFFDQMIASGIISVANPLSGYYYLTDSTPF